MRNLITVAATVVVLLVGGAELAAPALACGDTPGFCPNPSHGNDGWVVGSGGDWGPQPPLPF